MAMHSKTEADVLISEQYLRGSEFSPEPSRFVSRPRKSRFLEGWRKGVATGAFAACVALLVNVLATVAFVVHYGNNNGFATLFNGDCDQASRINFGVHLVINVLGTLLLASSNYCMQVLTAPTRKEVDEAHARGKYVDIGLQSARNLFRIRRWRVLVWVLLIISTLPLHLVYNSVVFSTVHAFEYNAVLASPGFVNGTKYEGPLSLSISNNYLGNEPTLADIQKIQADAASFQRLDNADCISAYQKALLTDRSDLILVTMFHNASDEQNNVFQTYSDGDFYLSFEGIARWMFDTYNNTDYEYLTNTGSLPDPSRWNLHGYLVDHCLSRPEQERCTVSSSIQLTIVVIICNVLKLAGLLVTLLAHKEEPLVTIGDAIDSFVTNPDPTTSDSCLLSRSDVKSGKFSNRSTRAKTFKRKRVFRFEAVSGTRWWLSVIVCIIGLIVIGIFLRQAVEGAAQSGLFASYNTPSMSQLWSLGFGLGQGTLFWQYAPPSLYANIMLANLPQLIFSMLYFIYNGLYTVMALASEWAAFASRRKTLRVSRPVGAQRSTYYLQLPYIYAVPLIVASTAMHWLISQSFFVLAVDFSSSSTPDLLNYSSCGYSPSAIIFSLALGGLMVIFVVVSGFGLMGFSMPVVGSCSLAISAACHPPPHGADSTAPLQWGVVAEGEVGHCAFSSEEVTAPVAGMQYAGRT